MGFYIDTPGVRFGKAQILCLEQDGLILKRGRPERFTDVPEGRTLIAVVQNATFDAAMIVADEREFERIAPRPNDPRYVVYLTIPEAKARELCPYAFDDPS